MTRVTAVKALESYCLWVRFRDGVEGSIDLSPLIGKGVFQPLADPAEFAKVFVDPITQTVAWPNGIDLCPDTLYEDIKAKQQAA